MKWEDVNFNEQEEDIFLASKKVRHEIKKIESKINRVNPDNKPEKDLPYELMQRLKKFNEEEEVKWIEYALLTGKDPSQYAYHYSDLKINQLNQAIQNLKKRGFSLEENPEKFAYSGILQNALKDHDAWWLKWEVKELNNLIKKYPTYYKAGWLKARIYEELGKYEKAIKRYREILEKAPESPYAKTVDAAMLRIHDAQETIIAQQIAKDAIDGAIQGVYNKTGISTYELPKKDHEFLIKLITDCIKENKIFDEQFHEKYCEYYSDKIGQTLYLNKSFKNNSFLKFDFLKQSFQLNLEINEEDLKNRITKAILFVRELIKSVPSAPPTTIVPSAPAFTIRQMTFAAKPSAPPDSPKNTIAASSVSSEQQNSSRNFYKSFKTLTIWKNKDLKKSPSELAAMFKKTSYPDLYPNSDVTNEMQSTSIANSPAEKEKSTRAYEQLYADNKINNETESNAAANSIAEKEEKPTTVYEELFQEDIFPKVPIELPTIEHNETNNLTEVNESISKIALQM